MRVWEVDDLKAQPGDIVREQDFIMRLRHMQRQSTPSTVINLSFGSVPALQANIEKREQIIRNLSGLITEQKGQLHLMSQGDAFIIAPDQSTQYQAILASIATVFHQHDINDPADIAKLMQAYSIPQDYAAARERTNHYIEAARASAQIGAANPAEIALQGDQVRGALTPWALDQIIQLFATIDIRRYVRSQSIYQHSPSGWQEIGAEYFVSVEELRRERFPRLDIRTPERLFMEICSELDYRLLNAFAEQPSSLASGKINLNVAVESVLGSSFAKFTHSLPLAQRQHMTFEINRGDMLLNFESTMNAMTLLTHEGFKIALDAIHPSMLPYINCAAFNTSYIKIRFGKDVLGQLQDPAVIGAIRKLPKERIILYRCDDEASLKAGLELGISLFQGWYIDDVVAGR